MILSIPGATPQSTMAVIFFSLAKASSSNEFSGKNEISITFISASIIHFKVWKPKNPGTAQITRSNFFIRPCKDLLSVTFNCLTVMTGCFCAILSRTDKLRSASVTLWIFAMSIAMELPTIPAPRTIMFFI